MPILKDRTERGAVAPTAYFCNTLSKEMTAVPTYAGAVTSISTMKFQPLKGNDGRSDDGNEAEFVVTECGFNPSKEMTAVPTTD